jgi:hypothetical protein
MRIGKGANIDGLLRIGGFSANGTVLSLNTNYGIFSNGTLGTNGNSLLSNGTVVYWGNATAALSSNVTINFVIDGGGSAITPGIKGDVEIPYDATLTGYTLLSDQAGTISIDLWANTFTNYPPTVTDSITNSAPMILTSEIAITNDIPPWSKSFTGREIVRFNVDSNSLCKRVTVVLKVVRI